MRKGQGEDLCWMRVVFGPSDDTAITHRHDSVIDITKWGPGILPETTVGKHNSLCHQQMPTKLYHAKRKPNVNMVQNRRRVLWAKANLKWTVQSVKVFYGQTSPNLTFLLEIMDAASSG